MDGNINVNGLTNGQGAYLGNGGKVLVNSAYLYQNGNITALGTQGGHVNINVNSATFGPTAKIDVSSPTGAGGSIHINASGVVDIQKGAVLNSSGIPLPGVDSNVIQVVGRVVNNEGVLSANGINNTSGMNNASKGGTIQLVANNGNPNLQPVVNALASSTVFSPGNKLSISNRLQGLVNNYANSIRNTGSIMANGGAAPSPFTNNGGNGGVITLTANRRILNQSTGVIAANGGDGLLGGNGGSIELVSQSRIPTSLNNGQIQANGGSGSGGAGSGPFGTGGNGGVLTLRNLTNNATISANGGTGGGVGSALSGVHGGNGGIIRALNVSNTASGTINANGNTGAGQNNSFGGTGGIMTANNFTNNGIVSLNGGFSSSTNNNTAGNGGIFAGANVINTGNISTNGGFAAGRGPAIGGNGGHIQISNLTNSGLIATNGGGGDGGGNGGLFTVNRVNNTGKITANGGNTYNNQFGTNLPAGNGGTIIGTQVTNTGTAQALGGISGFSPTLNGKPGTVIGF